MVGGFAREPAHGVVIVRQLSGRNFSATLRGSRRSSASYTMPMPPVPSLPVIAIVADGQAKHELEAGVQLDTGVVRLYSRSRRAPDGLQVAHRRQEQGV